MSDEDEPHDGTIHIAVIGNSNSIMRNSFAEVLNRDEGFTVENMSIGGTPNILLLDVLATVGDLEHDFIIVETAVIDAIQSTSGAYPPAIALRNLRLVIERIVSKSPGRIIFLLIPTRIALLEPNSYCTEDMYLSFAREFRIPVLNLYNLFRQMLGDYSVERIQRLSAWAPVVAEAFRIPRHAAYELSWSALRKQNVLSNSFAISGFMDHAHISLPVHRLVGNLLATWIHQAPCSEMALTEKPITAPFQAIAPVADGQKWTTRRSSLMKRDLLSLQEGGTATYRCPPGYVAAGLFLNRSQTSGFVKLESAFGSVVLDCRFIPHPLAWVGLVVPIIDPIGGGDITVTISAKADPVIPNRRLPDILDEPCITVSAEIAEMILINQAPDAASEKKTFEATETTGYDSIESAAWASALCENAYEYTESAIDGIGEVGFRFSKGLSEIFIQVVKEKSFSADVHDRARLLLLTCGAAAALDFLAESIFAGNDDPILLSKHQQLSAFLASLN